MYASRVRIQHSDRRKRSMTYDALVRLIRLRQIPLVLFHMLRQSVTLPTRIRTLRTLIRLMSRVYLNVRFQRRALFKRALAQRAFIRSFVAVNLNMLHQMAPLDERLTALGAQVRFLTRVLPHVQSELGWTAETLLANVTHFRTT